MRFLFRHSLTSQNNPKFEEVPPTSDTDFIIEGLQYDYLSDLLGFHTITRPLLTLEKEEFHTAAYELGDDPPPFGDSKGITILEGNIIFINVNLKYDYQLERVSEGPNDLAPMNTRQTYATFLKTLIHELVDFKCPDMQCTEVRPQFLV